MLELTAAWWNDPLVGGHRIRHATAHRRLAHTGSQTVLGPGVAVAQHRERVGVEYRPWPCSWEAAVNPAPPADPQSVEPLPGMETRRGRARLPLSGSMPAGPVRAFSLSQVMQGPR